MSQTNKKSKVAIVVGGTGGIGTALRAKLAEHGFTLVSVSRTGDIKCDLTDRDQIYQAIHSIQDTYGCINVLVHAAGLAGYADINAVTDDLLQSTFMVNLLAPMIFTRELLPLMSSTDSSILFLGSGAGVTPMAGRSVYCATKFGLRGFVLSLEREIAKKAQSSSKNMPTITLITLGSTMTHFGPLSIEDRKQAQKKGKQYLPVSVVANELSTLIISQQRPAEIILYPPGYQDDKPLNKPLNDSF